MTFLISSLIRGMKGMEELTLWVNEKPAADLGVELIAFTHDDEYWKRLNKLLEKLTCPITFHGPYIGVEATSLDGTKEQEWLFESYERVMRLAKKYEVIHIVYHTTQLGFSKSDKPVYLEQGKKNTKTLLKMAKEYGVKLLVENLPYPKKNLPLYNNQEYKVFFEEFPDALSIIDIGHAHMNGLDLHDFLSQYGKRTQAYHFHNNNGQDDQHNRITDGTFDFKHFANLYQMYTPDTNIVLEYEPHTRLNSQQLLEDVKWLEKYFK